MRHSGGAFGVYIKLTERLAWEVNGTFARASLKTASRMSARTLNFFDSSLVSIRAILTTILLLDGVDRAITNVACTFFLMWHFTTLPSSSNARTEMVGSQVSSR